MDKHTSSGRMARQEPKKLPLGVTIRQNKNSQSLRVSFSYRGVECKETLRLEPTPANIKYAERLRAEILNAIERNTFNYANYFPESKKCKLFGQVSSDITVGQLLAEYLETARKTLQPSTYRGYNEVSKAHLFPEFGKMRLVDLNAMVIRQWIQSKSLTMKRISNILIPLRHVLNQALVDNMIESNPLDKIVLTKIIDKGTRKSDWEVDPFSEEEIELVLKYSHGQVRNLFQFAFFTGLRTSELMALEWKHIDFEKGFVRVEQAQVEREIKTTKTKAGVREVMLHPPALKALQQQKQYTYLEFGRVFHNPRTQRPWETDHQIRRTAWLPIFNKAIADKVEIRYRNPYQTRHTFASMMLSRGENEWWVASQLGHRNTEMIHKHYGKWIKDNSQKAGYKPVHDWGQVLKFRKV
jgi:integrase